jgi:5-methylcytosine-specific restriction endonuclease McrA
MTFYPLPDEFYADPDFLSLSTTAIDLWTRAASWSAHHLTDGFVPAPVLPVLRQADDAAAVELIDRRVWKRARGGFQFVAWPKLASRSYVEEKREGNRTRRQLYSDEEITVAVRKRDGSRCRYCGITVKWSDRRSAQGGTYDHILPISKGGKNTVANVVVACRGCNSAKRDRSIEDAGMRLLPVSTRPEVTSSGLVTNQNGTRSELISDLPQSSPVQSIGSYVGGERPVGTRARDERPPERCPHHVNADTPPPCGACAERRRAAQAWDADTARHAADARSADARQRAADRAAAIAACSLCNDHGYIGRQLCDHDPDGPARAARGRAAVQDALARAREPT